MLTKDSKLLSQALTPVKLLELFEEVAPDGNVQLRTEITVRQFVHLLVKIAKLHPYDRPELGLRLQNVIENFIVVYGKRALETEGRASHLLQTLRPFIRPIMAMFQKFSNNRLAVKAETGKSAKVDQLGMLSSSMSIDDVNRFFYDAKLHAHGFTIEDILRMGERIIDLHADSDRRMFLPEFIDLLIALACTRYPNPFEDILLRVHRFLSRDLQLDKK